MLKIAICDDEEYFRDLLEHMIHEWISQKGKECVIEKYSSGVELLALGKHVDEIQLLFLDINMDAMDGLETAKKIRETQKKLSIVFVTAFVSYSIEGYKVNAFRYLLKNDTDMKRSVSECLNAFFEQIGEKKDTVELHFREGKKWIYVEHILYVESRLHKLFFLIVNDTGTTEIFTSYDTLNHIEELLKKKSFMRIHQSFLVNMNHIRKMERYMATLTGGFKIPVARARYGDVLKQYIVKKGEM